MNLLQFLFYLGTIYLIFSFVWQWVFVLPAVILLTAIKFSEGVKLIKILGTYLFVSLVAILTTTALKENSSIVSLVLYPALGALMLFIGFSRSVYERRQEARAAFDWEEMSKIERDATFDGVVIVGALILYFVALFIPSLSINPLTRWFWEVTDWSLHLPIIGVLIGVIGLLISLSVAFQGIVVSGVLVNEALANLKKTFSGKSNNPQPAQVEEKSIEPGLEKSDKSEKYCTSCGKGISLSQRYCTNCGAQLKG
jgi:hypothetical protein